MRCADWLYYLWNVQSRYYSRLRNRLIYSGGSRPTMSHFQSLETRRLTFPNCVNCVCLRILRLLSGEKSGQDVMLATMRTRACIHISMICKRHAIETEVGGGRRGGKIWILEDWQTDGRTDRQTESCPTNRKSKPLRLSMLSKKKLLLTVILRGYWFI